MPKIKQSKPRASATNSGKTKSLRVKLDGLVTPAELRQMFNEAVDRMEELGATHLRGCYFYATPCDVRGQTVSLVQNRRVVSEVTIEPPYRSAADEHGL